MCRKIFIGATGQNCGKTTISLSLMHLAGKRYKRVGFMKPIGPKCVEYKGLIMDKDAAMMASVYGLDEDGQFISPVTIDAGSTRRYLDGNIPPGEPQRLILEAYRKLEKKYDFLIIEGAGHGGVGSVIGANNATVAAMLDAPVLLVGGGGIGNTIDSLELNLALYAREGADVRAIMVNKLVPEKRESSMEYLSKALHSERLFVTSSFNYYRVLADPTLSHVSELLNEPLNGDLNDRSRICHTIQMGAASSQRVIDKLDDSTLLIVNSSRDELIVTSSSLHHIPEFKNRLAGLVVAGHGAVSNITKRILDDSKIPYIRAEETSAEVFYQLRDHVSKIGPDDTEKIELINSIAEKYIDFDKIDAMLDRP